MRCSVYIAASVDGFVARPDGDVSWLENSAYRTGKCAGLGFEAFMATVDALAMGRRTFEKVLTFGRWPYGKTPVVVLSSGSVTVPEHLRGTVTMDGGAVEDVASRLAERGLEHLYVDGGVTMQRFLEADLVNELIITWVPILLGAGIPLFASTGRELPLTLLATEAADSGLLQCRYRVG